MATRIYFTKDALEALAPAAKPYRVYDTKEDFLAAEVLPSGRIRFLVRRRPSKHAPQRQWDLGVFPGVSVAAARAQARIIDGEISRGEVKDKASAIRFDAFWTIYKGRKFDDLSPATVRAYKDAYERAERMHHLRLDAITRADLARLHGDLGEQSRSVADKVRAAISSVMGSAYEWGYLEVVPKMPKPFGQEKRERWLSPGECHRLLASADKQADWFGDYLRLLLLTGSRKMEVAAMRWDQISLDKSLWRRKQKGGRVSPTALSQAAIAILRRRQAASKSPWVFPSPRKGGHLVSPGKLWYAAVADAGLVNVRIHDLRHTHATLAHNEGVALSVVGGQLGHRHATTTERYVHPSITHQIDGVEVVAGIIMAG